MPRRQHHGRDPLDSKRGLVAEAFHRGKKVSEAGLRGHRMGAQILNEFGMLLYLILHVLDAGGKTLFDFAYGIGPPALFDAPFAPVPKKAGSQTGVPRG